jgi:hypothetical protein
MSSRGELKRPQGHQEYWSVSAQLRVRGDREAVVK